MTSLYDAAFGIFLLTKQAFKLSLKYFQKIIKQLLNSVLAEVCNNSLTYVSFEVFFFKHILFAIISWFENTSTITEDSYLRD